MSKATNMHIFETNIVIFYFNKINGSKQSKTHYRNSLLEMPSDAPNRLYTGGKTFKMEEGRIMAINIIDIANKSIDFTLYAAVLIYLGYQQNLIILMYI